MKFAARMAALLLLLLLAVDISIGADIARLTVINETERFARSERLICGFLRRN